MGRLAHVKMITPFHGQRMERLFVLTTRATHWFIEHGFEEVGVDRLPSTRQALYNFQRRSKVLVKVL